MTDIDFENIGNGIDTTDKPVTPQSVVSKSSLNLDTIHQLIEQNYNKEIARLEFQEENIVVKDDKTNESAISVGSTAKKLRQAMENKRKEIIAPAKEFVDGVNGKIKKYVERLKSIEESTKSKSGQYQYKVELERKKHEEAIRKANIDLQKKLDAEAKKSGVTAPVVEPAPLPKRDTVVRTDSGATSYLRRKWKAKIIDPEKVERKYCSPDLKILQIAVDMGARKLAGCEVYEDVTTVYR